MNPKTAPIFAERKWYCLLLKSNLPAPGMLPSVLNPPSLSLDAADDWGKVGGRGNYTNADSLSLDRWLSRNGRTSLPSTATISRSG